MNMNMKSLNNYITEKLIINKNFKGVLPVFNFKGIEPGDTGNALNIAYTVKNEENSYNYITLNIIRYYKNHNSLVKEINSNKDYKKNSKGFYEIVNYYNKYWNQCLLFGEDAIMLLEEIGKQLNNTLSSIANIKIDISYIFDNKPVTYWPMKIRTFNNDTDFSNYDINSGIKELKK